MTAGHVSESALLKKKNALCIVRHVRVMSRKIQNGRCLTDFVNVR